MFNDPYAVVDEQTYKTPNGKVIKLENDIYGLWQIVFSNGGEKPKELCGKYTDMFKAKDDVENYLIKKQAEAEAKEAKKQANTKAE